MAASRTFSSVIIQNSSFLENVNMVEIMRHQGGQAMDIKPSVRRRFEFIDFQLQWAGSIGRKALQEQFEISPQQATNDLTTYLDIAPRNMSYDPRRRSYVVSSKFKPKFSSGESSGFFLHLEMFH